MAGYSYLADGDRAKRHRFHIHRKGVRPYTKTFAVKADGERWAREQERSIDTTGLPLSIEQLKNNVFMGNIDEFSKLKEKLKSQTKEQRLLRATDKARLKEIADILEVSYSRIDGGKLTGRTGYISADGVISADGRSKRHLSGIARRLSFLDKTDTGFKLDRPLTASEAETVRGVLGLKKRPSLTAPPKVDRPIENVAA